MTNPAPSEEFVLTCDVSGCPAQLSMVSGIPRHVHGWGRLSLDTHTHYDYDLCSKHLRMVQLVLNDGIVPV